MFKTGIYVDAENIRLSGGYGMRYDVLVELANRENSQLLRANSYLAEDRERTESDPEYRQKVHNYHDVVRNCGFKVIKKYVQHYVDEEGVITTKANADMDLAIDALLQSRNLDRVILVTGDGDFIRLVTAIQNRGCRVEVIGFKNVSAALRETADFFISGFLVPGLLPIQGDQEPGDWCRGTVISYKPDRGFGFMRYYKLTERGLESENLFFHCSQSPFENSPQVFHNSANIFEFQIAPNNRDSDKFEARNIRLLQMENNSTGSSDKIFL